MGLGAVRFTNHGDLRAAVAEGMASGKPNLVDTVVDGTV